MNESLEPLIARLANDATFMAWVVNEYLTDEGISRRELGERWRYSPTSIRRLQICRRPDSASPQFITEVRRIAEACEIAEGHIFELIRHVEVIGRHREEPVAGTTAETFLAARDQHSEEPS